MARGVFAFLLLCASACASGAASRVPDPLATTAQFAAAIERDDAGAAYALLDPQLRQRLGRERFLRLWRENRAELRELGQQLRERALAAKAYAHVELEHGERVALVLEDGHYHLQGGVLDAQALDTPLDAVAELRRALLRQSLPGLLRVLARDRRAAWLAAFEQNIAQTADPLDLQVTVNGDEATVRLSGGGQILLRREGGRWQVWDVRLMGVRAGRGRGTGRGKFGIENRGGRAELPSAGPAGPCYQKAPIMPRIAP
jgi:hypothetical protein